MLSFQFHWWLLLGVGDYKICSDVNKLMHCFLSMEHLITTLVVNRRKPVHSAGLDQVGCLRLQCVEDMFSCIHWRNSIYQCTHGISWRARTQRRVYYERGHVGQKTDRLDSYQAMALNPTRVIRVPFTTLQTRKRP